MSVETLNFWAAVAAIFLFANAILVTLFMGVSIGFGWWYLRKGRKALAMPLLMAQVYALRVQTTTTKVCDSIANVPIQINQVTTQVTSTAKILVGRSDGKP